jgi:ABC-type Mn2+/Zn2+ transport system permease subunit
MGRVDFVHDVDLVSVLCSLLGTVYVLRRIRFVNFGHAMV